MVQSPSWEANWFAASQEIPPISRNPKVHYRTHNRPPPVQSWASPIQSIYTHPTSWRSILILPTHLRLGLPRGLLPLRFPHQDPIHPLSSPKRATCPAHPILLDFITRTILGEEYKSFSSSLCNLLHNNNNNNNNNIKSWHRWLNIHRSWQAISVLRRLLEEIIW